jgi:hypothetical protein
MPWERREVTGLARVSIRPSRLHHQWGFTEMDRTGRVAPLAVGAAEGVIRIHGAREQCSSSTDLLTLSVRAARY